MGRKWRATKRSSALSSGALLLVASVVASIAGFATADPPVAASASSPGSATYFSKQWGLAQINAPAAWQYGTGSGVKIGFVDTGVDLSHPDLAGKVAASATCTNTGGDPSQCVSSSGAGQDDNGHGTHVAGIAAGAGNGIAGVAPGASLVVAKVLDSSGSGSTSDVSAGIEWVVDHGARVVNLSLGASPGFLGLSCVLGACDSSTITSAVEAAWHAGAIPVVAAGNNAGDLFGPSGYGNLDAIVVAATGPTGAFASDYSSTPGDAKWGVLAPGGDDTNGATTPACGSFDPDEIVSSYWSNGPCYATDEGTSMATPFVSGTLALLLARGLNQPEAVEALLSTLNTGVTCGGGQGCLGLVNAGAAMAAAARVTGGSGSAPSVGAPGGAHTTAPTSRTGVAGGSSGLNTGRSPTNSTTSTSGTSVLPATAGLGSDAHPRDSSLRSADAAKPSSGNSLLIGLLAGAGALVVAVAAFVLRRRAASYAGEGADSGAQTGD